MAAIYKALSAVLSYPEAELQTAAGEIAAVLEDCAELSSATARNLTALARRIASEDLLDLQAGYVDLFDRTRSLSLHLFEHVHGESRDRGQAMVDLRQRYCAAGMDIAAAELPDYLPLLLEFLSLRPVAETQALLGDAAHVLRALQERLVSRNSPYAAVFAALEELGKREPDLEQLAEMRRTVIDDPADLAALDRVWEETEVRFGDAGEPGSGCPMANHRMTEVNPS